MPVTTDIVASYRGPRRVMRRILELGTNEGRALAVLMAGCAVFFIADWPKLARDAHISGDELQPILGGSLMGWIFIAPLIFYVFAWLSQLVIRLFGGNATGFSARMALFWAFLAASPLKLFHGLVAGFIGPGPVLNGVGALWLLVFLWFWVSNMREAGWAA
ncbi:MAG: YIP1 family protein [Pseudomonadota bacterium]